jgi:hypothetical protein
LHKFKENLEKEFNVQAGEYPENEEDRLEFQMRVHKYLTDNYERKYTPEFYEMYANLSAHTNAALDGINIEIRKITNKYVKDGIFNSYDVSDEDWVIYENLRKEKKNLSNELDSDGNKKTGIDLYIAKELTIFNKTYSENIKYKKNLEAFEKARVKAETDLTPEQYDKWENRNTVLRNSEEFNNLLKLASTTEKQSTDYQTYNKTKKDLLKLYRNPETGLTDLKNMPEDVKDQIRQLDKWLSKNKKLIKTQVKFSDFAEIVTSQEWLDEQTKFLNRYNNAKKKGDTALMNEIAKEFQQFKDNTTYQVVRQDGTIDEYVYSFYTKIEPLDKTKYTERVPSSIWSEMDKDSPFVNKKYVGEHVKYVMIPKAEKYANPAWDKVKKNQEFIELRDSI